MPTNSHCNDLIFTVPTLCTHPAVEEVWNRKSDTSKIADRGVTPLHKAAWKGHVDVVKFLIAKMTIKMPQDARGWSPLHYSSSYGQFEATIALLDAIGNNSSYITQHAYKERNYYTPLHEAVGQGQTTIVELFLDRIVGNKNPKAAFTNYVSMFLSFFAKFSLFKLVFHVIVEVSRWLNIVTFLFKFQSFQSKIVDSLSTGFM